MRAHGARRCAFLMAIACCGVLSVMSLHAQNAQCLEMVRDVYRRMSGATSAPGKAARFRYVVRTTANWRGKSRVTVSNVELIATNSRLYMTSDQAEVAQDERTVVTVLPERRLIYIAGSNLEAFRKMRGNTMTAMRDSVLAASEVSECVALADGKGGADRRVTLQIRPSARRQLQLQSVTMYLNSTRRTIQRMVCVPTSDNAMTSVDVEFQTVEYDYPADRFLRPILEQFVDSSGRPLAKYKGYTVTDARRTLR